MYRNDLLPAIGLLLIATVFWGGMFDVSMTALAAMDAYHMTLLRFAGTSLILLVILLRSEGLSALRLQGNFRDLFLLGTLGFAGFNLLVFNGLAHTRPEHAAVIMALQPMIAVLLTWILKGSKPHRFTLATVATAFVGVFLVITGGNPAAAFAGDAALWDLLFLAGALCWVGYTLGAQKFPDWSPLRYTSLTAVLGTASIAAITVLLGMNGSIRSPELTTLTSLHWTFAYLIIAGGVVAVLSWNSGIRKIGPVNGVLFINFVPITAFSIGIAQGREFSNAELFGAALVILALVSNNLYLRRASSLHLPVSPVATGKS
ncbi:transporter [Marinobacterium zhoushanense]|uniref:Transporter n=1 Tax=Marinobacterium zhoushanense TaxID=1679163 RepID=A0ABQ1KJ87_9GAMM|nr:DMT family transporter [Marinobacterium zhoushanense]GGC01564.1 transporter [Marinobacterium zhoushanense]